MTDTTQTELVPCPFCGGKLLVVRFDETCCPVEHEAYAHCVDCDATGPVAYGHDTQMEAQAAAITAWNTRQPTGIAEDLHLMKTAGIVEVAVRNPSVAEYMEHWEGRAIKAEAERGVAAAAALQMAAEAYRKTLPQTGSTQTPRGVQVIRNLIDPDAPSILAERERAAKVEGVREVAALVDAHTVKGAQGHYVLDYDEFRRAFERIAATEGEV